MNRRELIRTAVQAGVAASLPSAERDAQALSTEQQAGSDLPPSLIGSAAMDGYFSEERLIHALGVQTLLRPADVQVIAFNFPSWHATPYMEKYFGKGWTEYDTLQNARPLFPGHSMPHYPLWGYYNEADPAWAAREIDLAADHGVDAWMIDWYWHAGQQFYQEQLEEGFLKAPNKSRLRFAIMWANHDWKNVYPARSPDDAALLLPQTHSFEDFENVTNYCAEKYFSQPSYFRIDDAPLFGIFDIGKVIQQLGEDGLKHALQIMRERSHKLGFSKIHLQVCNGAGRFESRLREFGFDSETLYGTFAWTYGAKPPGSRIPYGVGASEAISLWQQRSHASPVPFFPTCSAGWDDSPRFGHYSSVAINRTPDQFERLVRAARHFVSPSSPRLIYVGAWNEWTEDSVLLPDTLWGYSYLEALHRAVRD